MNGRKNSFPPPDQRGVPKWGKATSPGRIEVSEPLPEENVAAPISTMRKADSPAPPAGSRMNSRVRSDRTEPYRC